MNCRSLFVSGLIILLFLQSCAIIAPDRKPEIKEGRYFETCDIHDFRALSFENGQFLEERQRPHLGSPVIFAQGTYQLKNDSLILQYQPLPEGFDQKISFQPKDTAVEQKTYHFRFSDLQNYKPLPGLTVRLVNNEDEIIENVRTDREGNATISIDDDLEDYHFETSYVFYANPEVIPPESDKKFQKVHVSLRAGVEERKETGEEVLLIRENGWGILDVHFPERGTDCTYEILDIEQYRQDRIERELWERNRSDE